jgi:hypothetical protein
MVGVFLKVTLSEYNYGWRGGYASFVLNLRNIDFLSSTTITACVRFGLHEHGFTKETTFHFLLTILKSYKKFTDLSFCLGYIGEFEIIDDHRSGKIVVQLNGRLNKTGVISPRFNVQHSQIESWVNLLLPARSFGIIILVICLT